MWSSFFNHNNNKMAKDLATDYYVIVLFQVSCIINFSGHCVVGNVESYCMHRLIFCGLCLTTLWKLQREMTSWVRARACNDCVVLENSFERKSKWGCRHVDIYITVCLTCLTNVCVCWGGGGWRKRWLGYLHYHEERERERHKNIILRVNRWIPPW